MHISRVELEDFKSHVNSAFEFGMGTTAITGRNGAGKTSIIEAIAWALFDTLEYKKDEIIRRGSKKAVVRVTLNSGLDEREYTVYRDSGAGYYVFDPRLNLRIADKKEEVTRFLWQHLGLEPGTDLDGLFRHAIGVPQGTLTAIFLAPVAERKRTFDSLLKVDEYRRSSDELLKTVRFLEQRIAEVDIKLARSEGEIARIEPLEVEKKELVPAERSEAETFARLEQEVKEKQELVAGLDRLENEMASLRANLEETRSAHIKAELIVKQSEDQLARAKTAAEAAAKAEPGYRAHQDAVGRLKELERERVLQKQASDELAKTDAALASVAAEQKHLAAELERIQAAHTEAAGLKPLAAEQERLETELRELHREQARLEASAGKVEDLDRSLAKLRESYKALSERLSAAKTSFERAADLTALERRSTVLIDELAGARAALERDQSFQREIKNGLCPILSEKCLNLKEGETLESFVASQFEELNGKITVLTSEKANVETALRAAREAEGFGKQITLLEARLAEVTEEGNTFKEQRAAIENETGRLPELRADIQRKEKRLDALENPKVRLGSIDKEISREPLVRDKLGDCEKNLERLESDRRLSVEKLEDFKDLDSSFAEAASVRDNSAEAYRTYLANEALAAQVAALGAELEKLNVDLAEASAGLEKASKRVAEVSKDYDRERHLKERADLSQLENRRTEFRVGLETKRRRLAEIDGELEALYKVRSAMTDDRRERERLKKVGEATEFIRSTLKEAAPLVARNYVHHVSVEANRLFGDIAGDPGRTLKWAEDYGIQLEEGGYDRPFQSLSGGEQMAAALSVRLAILTQLSDIRIAFFDEPTANMDAERRENLAEQIGQIKHFDQLFVISHDDTFEGYLDNEIRIDN